MGDDCQSVQLASEVHGTRDGAEPEMKMSTQKIEEVKKAFATATTVKKYKAALARARALRATGQHAVLDAMFAAADRLGVARSTGEPLGMQQELDGSVTVSWEQKITHVDGTVARVASSAVLQPNDYGKGWHSSTKDVPEEVMEAVESAALHEELKAHKRGRRRRVTSKSGRFALD